MLILGSVTKALRSICKNITEKDPCIRLHHITSGGLRPYHPVLDGMNNMIARLWSEFHCLVHLHLLILSLL